MHTVGIKYRLYEWHTWVARSLYRACVQARQLAYDSLYNMSALRVTLPWILDDVEADRAFFGEDCWPYGITRNQVVLDALTQYAHEQGLTSRKLAVDSLFAPNTLDDGTKV